MRILSLVTYACLLISIIFAATGWYFQTLHMLSFTLSGLAGFTGVVLYIIRMYVVTKLSKVLLKGYHHVKGQVKGHLQEQKTARASRKKEEDPLDNLLQTI